MKFIGNFTKAMKVYAEEKLKKLEKYTDINNATVSFKKLSKEDKLKVEISLDKIRASKIGEDYYDLVIKIIDKLNSQIKRHKSTEEYKRESYGINDFLYEDPNNDPDYIEMIIKDNVSKKQVIDEMDLLDHTFFVCNDVDK